MSVSKYQEFDTMTRTELMARFGHASTDEILDEMLELHDELAKAHARIARLEATGDKLDVGRPREFTEAQAAWVTKLRAKGRSLRAIADEVEIGLSSVRTVLRTKDTRKGTARKALAAERAKRYRAAHKALKTAHTALKASNR